MTALRPAWHYTTGECFKRILSVGVLRCQAKPAGETPYPHYHGTPLAPGEPPAVWFSRNQWWEPTASKGLYDPATRQTIRTMTMTECYERGSGLVRLAVSHTLHPWEEYVRTLDARFAAGLARSARELGSNVKHFFCSFEPISRSEWTQIEVFNGRRWIPEPRRP